ncbi:MAG: O-antigen ligase family protein [Candidatus Cloacimonetes bacterium]|nr:O-antigen ligase family protein [Candidatus Cloacimonadota bacterium]
MLINIIIFILIIAILKYSEIGLALIVIIPLIKKLEIFANCAFGVDLSLLFMLVTIVSFLIHYSQNVKSIFIKKKCLIEKKHLILFLLFTLTLSLSYFYTKSSWYGSEKLLKFIFFNGFFFISGIVIFQIPRNIFRFSYILLFVVFLISIADSYLILKYIFSGRFIESLITRFTITGENPIGLSRVMGLGIIFGLILLDESNKKLIKIGIMLALLPIIFSMLATNTRTAVIILFFIVLIYIIFFSRLKIGMKFIQLISIIAIIVVMIYVLPQSLTSRYVTIFNPRQFNIPPNISEAMGLGVRLYYCRQIIEYFINNPLRIMFGTGIGNFSSFFGVDTMAYPHNIFMEILYEQGIVGLSIFIIGIILIIKEISRKFHSINEGLKSIFIIFLFSFIYFFIHAQINGDIPGNRFVWLFWGGIIGIISFTKHERIDS